MDPDHVRLLLLLLGVLLVVGIYLWDRYKHAAPRMTRPRRPPAADPVPATGAAESSEPARSEPQLGDLPEATYGPSGDPPIAEPAAARRDLDPEPADLGEWSTPAGDAEPQMAMELNFDAHGDSDYLHTDPALYDEVERKIVVINLVARGDAFGGPAIEKACSAVQLRLGDMSIFHHHDGASGAVLFSMASMVEPGVFPAEDVDGFSTPGLSLFTQLPGARDGVAIYDAMLATAKQLATLLDGELQDDRHNKLTRQMEDHMRDSIIEHRRKINLARSRH